MRATWKRIAAWLDNNAPDLAKTLTKGERASDIRDFAKRVGRKLPDDFTESLRIHSKSGGLIPDPMRSGLGYNHAFSLIPLQEIERSWRMLTDLYDSGEFDSRAEETKSGKGVVRQAWSASWIPFASNGGGDYFCVDLGPTWPGTRGQIVFVTHEASVRPRISSSFASMLAALADSFDRGDYEISERCGPVRKKPTKFPDAKD